MSRERAPVAASRRRGEAAAGGGLFYAALQKRLALKRSVVVQPFRLRGGQHGDTCGERRCRRGARVPLGRRAGFTDVARAPYLRTALAKGFSPAEALWPQGRRHAALTTLAAVTPELAWVIGGTAVAEIVFGPGLSDRVVEAVATRDYPVLQAFLRCRRALDRGHRRGRPPRPPPPRPEAGPVTPFAPARRRSGRLLVPLAPAVCRPRWTQVISRDHGLSP